VTYRLLIAGLIALGSLGTLGGTAAAKAAPIAAKTGALAVTGGYVAEAPPGARVTAAFMTLRNPGKLSLIITGVSSPDFTRVELHETRRDQGMAKMVRLPDLTVPGGGSVTLAHGGKHVMLFYPKRTLKVGDTIALTLQFAGAPTMTVRLPVRAMAGGHGHGGPGHGGHDHPH
jgi:copper(I)-binding protein